MDIFTKVSPGKILEISAIIKLKDFITVIVVLFVYFFLFVCKDNIVKLLDTINLSIIVIMNILNLQKRRINHDKHTINEAILHV